MMKQMGMNLDEVSWVERVVLQGGGREVVIEGPQVMSLNMQGTKMYQVVGGTETEGAPGDTSQAVQVPEEDVLLVAQQAGVGVEEARRALLEAEGDLARAIILLQSR